MINIYIDYKGIVNYQLNTFVNNLHHILDINNYNIIRINKDKAYIQYIEIYI